MIFPLEQKMLELDKISYGYLVKLIEYVDSLTQKMTSIDKCKLKELDIKNFDINHLINIREKKTENWEKIEKLLVKHHLTNAIDQIKDGIDEINVQLNKLSNLLIIKYSKKTILNNLFIYLINDVTVLNTDIDKFILNNKVILKDEYGVNYIEENKNKSKLKNIFNNLNSAELNTDFVMSFLLDNSNYDFYNYLNKKYPEILENNETKDSATIIEHYDPLFDKFNDFIIKTKKLDVKNVTLSKILLNPFSCNTRGQDKYNDIIIDLLKTTKISDNLEKVLKNVTYIPKNIHIDYFNNNHKIDDHYMRDNFNKKVKLLESKNHYFLINAYTELIVDVECFFNNNNTENLNILNNNIDKYKKNLTNEEFNIYKDNVSNLLVSTLNDMISNAILFDNKSLLNDKLNSYLETITLFSNIIFNINGNTDSIKEEIENHYEEHLKYLNNVIKKKYKNVEEGNIVYEKLKLQFDFNKKDNMKILNGESIITKKENNKIFKV